MKKLFLHLFIGSALLMGTSETLYAMEEDDINIQEEGLLGGSKDRFSTLRVAYNLFLKTKTPLQILFYLVTLGYISVNVVYTYLSTSILKGECTSCATQLNDVNGLIGVLSEAGKLALAVLNKCPAAQMDTLKAFELLQNSLKTCCNVTM